MVSRLIVECRGIICCTNAGLTLFPTCARPAVTLMPTGSKVIHPKYWRRWLSYYTSSEITKLYLCGVKVSLSLEILHIAYFLWNSGLYLEHKFNHSRVTANSLLLCKRAEISFNRFDWNFVAFCNLNFSIPTAELTILSSRVRMTVLMEFYLWGTQDGFFRGGDSLVILAFLEFISANSHPIGTCNFCNFDILSLLHNWYFTCQLYFDCIILFYDPLVNFCFLCFIL